MVNREKILTVAAELMGQHGHHIALADIADAAGVGIGTFYRGFPDRTALLHALEHRAYNLLIGALERIDGSGATGAVAIRAYLEECLALGDQLVLPLRGAPPLTDPEAIEARRRINHALEKFLAEGHAAGVVRADINATDVIVCAAMVTQPLPRGPHWSRIARRHIALFIDGIQTVDGQHLGAVPVTRQDIETAFGAEPASRPTPLGTDEVVHDSRLNLS